MRHLSSLGFLLALLAGLGAASPTPHHTNNIVDGSNLVRRVYVAPERVSVEQHLDGLDNRLRWETRNWGPDHAKYSEEEEAYLRAAMSKTYRKQYLQEPYIEEDKLDEAITQWTKMRNGGKFETNHFEPDPPVVE